jgi:hypothetical protein
MIPTDYRLEQVATRLAERLEGTRRSFVGQPDVAAEEFRRIADEHADAAIAEFREVGMVDEPEPHAKFLRRELIETFLPRYRRLARDMTAAEEAGFGLGVVAKPLGRLGLGFVTLLLLALTIRLGLMNPVLWPLLLVVLALPFLPDIAGALHRRRYHRSLVSMLEDMAKVQDQASAYLRPHELHPERRSEKRPRPQGEIQ